ncbi:MAG TPA: GDP-mannose 4,6-dehydratase [Rhodanobacteraceae bacterium]|nr:GDP-mannose 4,6-dehydratase [Rhodanobacteraceae bacterium]
MPRALIVGHTGQDGRILWQQLAAQGFALGGISRSRQDGLDGPVPTDINDADAVRRLVDNFCPDQIYFLAAYHHSSQDLDSNEVNVWGPSWATHVHAFSHFLQATRESNPAARIFYASSSRVFGPAPSSPQNEDTPFRPECIYGVTKASAMMLAGFYRRVHGMHVSCGILFNHESRLRPPQFVSRRIVDGLLAIRQQRAEVLEIGSLGARVDWGYAPDYTRAMQSMLETAPPDDYVVATGETHSVSEMIDVAASCVGVDTAGRIVESAGIIHRQPQILCGNACKLRNATGWRPSIGFTEMVRKLAEEAMHSDGVA